MNPGESQVLRNLQREQMRLRLGLATVLLAATCAFALMLAWLAQGDPLRPLLAVKTSLLGLLVVYAIAVAVAAIYARWIRVRRDPLVRASKAN
jgi:ACR3 family arsenite efflux pump ArsB